MSDAIELIQPLPVERDAEGYWVHPGIPDFDEDWSAYKAWLDSQGLDIKIYDLENEDDTHPAYIKYFDEGDPNVSDWNVEPPEGEGWFIFSIHMTEDSCVWIYARRIAKDQA